MKQKTFFATNRPGLSSRAAATFVYIVKRSRSEVWIEKDGEKRDGKRILDLLTVAAPHSSEFTVTVVGEDEDAVMTQISQLIESEFATG